MSSVENTLNIALTAIHNFDQEMEIFFIEGEKIAKRTNQIINTVLIIIMLAILYMFYITWQLSSEIIHLSTHMIQMYDQFGVMTQHVNAITDSVKDMNKHTTNIFYIAKDMQNMSHNVSGMQHSVADMDNSVASMNLNMYKVTMNVQEMAIRFNAMTGSVQGMGWNVNQMQQPTNMLPLFMWH